MKISQKAWKKYLEKLNRLDTKASNALAEYFRGYDVLNASENDLKRLLDCAYALATYYGEGAGELACEMYDAIGIASGKILPPAEPAPTATYGEVAKAVQGAMLKTQNPEAIGAVVGTKVKTVGLDTMLKNSLRDGAEFAWVPAGDTCPFCMMLASNGWQRASKKALKNGHAEHVHNNCDCTYAIRFDENTEVEGYNPDYYKEIYDNAEGHGYKEKINSMRRERYAANKDEINAQKRAAYLKRSTSLDYHKGPVTSYLNAPTIFNSDDVVDSFINSIEIPDEPIVVEKVKKSVRHMPIKDLEFIKEQGLIVEKTDMASCFVRDSKTKGKDGKLKYVIKINEDLDEPFVFAHECAHLAEKANNLYNDPEFVEVLNHFCDSITRPVIGEVDGAYYVMAKSDLLIEPYQGRTYIKDLGALGLEREVTNKDFVEYISVGYECFVGNPALLDKTDQELYNYFERRGLR